jgi:dihydrofolate reductase
MRQLILQMECSIDGFVATESGGLDWIYADFDADYERWAVEGLWQAGAHLMGREAYRLMAAHWPQSNEPYAAPMNRLPKIVFSKTLVNPDWENTQVVSGDLAQEITKLKQEPGNDLLAHGGARFATALVRHRLIDEYRLIVHPVALASGLRIFHELDTPLRLRLRDTTRFQSGTVVQRYAANA